MSVIYKIENKDKQIIYIGSTNNLYNRIATHKQRYHNGTTYPLYNYMRQNGSFDDYVIDVIEETNDKLIRERYWIDHYKPICNYCKPLRTAEERRLQCKKSYLKNIDKYRAYALEPIECFCGRTYTRQNRNRHENSKYHLDNGTPRSHDTL